MGKALAFSRVQPAALVTHAFKDIPLETLALGTVFFSVSLTLARPWLIESMKC